MKDLIGIMDSGVGGVSVLCTARRMLPHENFIYFGDNKNAPYGPRDIEEIRRLSRAACAHLLNKDSGFSFDILPSHRLCEAMGNLLDNALEAAQQSTSPQVNLMLRSTPEYNEILLDNTYSEASDLSFLSGDAKSSKEGHQAIGISSVRKVLAKYPNACFNMYVQGRYIEASLCEYKR